MNFQSSQALLVSRTQVDFVLLPWTWFKVRQMGFSNLLLSVKETVKPLLPLGMEDTGGWGGASLPLSLGDLNGSRDSGEFDAEYFLKPSGLQK